MIRIFCDLQGRRHRYGRYSHGDNSFGVLWSLMALAIAFFALRAVYTSLSKRVSEQTILRSNLFVYETALTLKKCTALFAPGLH